jgi:hypothetical protein
MSKPTETRVVGDVIEKKCRTCGKFKSLNEFHQAATCSYGVQNKCKECCKVEYSDNREAILYRQKEYARNNKEKISERNFRNHIKVRYDLTEEQYSELTKTGCLICGTFDDLAVDHDHNTNEVRGILCRTCNRGLGTFKENVNLLLKAAAYLESKQGCAIPEIRSNESS